MTICASFPVSCGNERCEWLSVAPDIEDTWSLLACLCSMTSSGCFVKTTSILRSGVSWSQEALSTIARALLSAREPSKAAQSRRRYCEVDQAAIKTSETRSSTDQEKRLGES